jgi:hypothetical protein
MSEIPWRPANGLADQRACNLNGKVPVLLMKTLDR